MIHPWADAFKLKLGPFIGEGARRGRQVDNRNLRHHWNIVVAATGVNGEKASARRRLNHLKVIIRTAHNESENDLCGAPQELEDAKLWRNPDKV